MTPLSRRDFLRSAGAVALLGLGGCRVGVVSRAEVADTPGASTPSTTLTTVADPATTSTTPTTMPAHLRVSAPPADVPNLDPIKWAEPHIQRVYRPSVESLYRWHPDGEAEPLLAAEPWDVSRDGLVYTVRLREDVSFHDGTMLDAAAVVAGFRAVIDPVNGSQWAPRLAGTVATIEAAGTSTVVFTLSRPFSPFETLLGLVPVVSAAEQYEPQLTYARSLSGTGPFVLSWEDDEFRYSRFAGHHAPPGQVQGFTLSFADPAAAAAGLTSKTTDLAMAVDPGWPGPEPIPAEGSVVRYRAIANLDPARVTSSFAFRRALWRSIDRNGIIDAALEGHGTPAHSVLSPSTRHAADQEMLSNWVAQPTRIPSPTTEPLSLVTTDDPTMRAIARGVQDGLADLGFGSKLDTVPGDHLTALFRPGEPGVFGDFDLLVVGSFAQPLTAFAPDYAYFGLRSGLITNLSKTADPTLDALLDAAVAAPPKERMARWEEVQKYDVSASLVEIPLVEGRYAEATRLPGYRPSPMGTLDHLAGL